MTQRGRRFGSSIILGLMLALLLAGCTITVPALPVAPTGAPPPTGDGVDNFAGQLMLAIIQRDYGALQGMMGNPFTIGYWQSEGVSYPPGIAIADLRSNYLPPGATPAFDTTIDLTGLLDGIDPLTIWGPEVNAVKAVYVTGLGLERRDEAILIVALNENGQPYWHSMLAAPGGFVRGEPAPTMSPTPGPPTPTPAIPPPSTGVYPTEVRLIRVLQNVNVRNGPGTHFDRIGRYVAGQVVDVFGANSNATWWNVRCPNGTVGNCWVTAERDTTQPTTQTGPTPTPTLTPLPPPGAPIRIQFPPGGTAATVEGLVRPPQQVQYVLRALAGQEMTVEISSPGGLANFAITGAGDGQPYKRLVNEDRSYSFRLPVTQDYLITVASVAGAVDFSLTVTVITPGPPPPPNDPIRIQFEPGAISASVSGSLFSGDRQEYLVRALAGQEMTVELYGDSPDTLLAIRGADGTVYKRGEIGGPFFSFTLPATQDYILTVVAAGGGTSYTMVVTIY